MTHRTAFRKILGTASLSLLICIGAAQAGQHLVSPGDDWSRLQGRLKPGDEVILLPGRHVAVTLSDVCGDERNPIVIRGFDAKHPALIGARDYGIELVRPQFVILRDLRIAGAQQHGVYIHAEPADGAAEQTSLLQTHVRLERVRIENTGADFESGIAFEARGARNIRLQDCVFIGFGAAAVQGVACEGVHIENCIFRGNDHFAQDAGIIARAGSARWWIVNSSFDRIAGDPLRLGGASQPEEFIPHLLHADASEHAQPRPAPHEAEQIDIESCIVRGGRCAIVLDSANRCAVRASTFVNPDLFVVRMAHSTAEPGVAPTAQCDILGNIFVWDNQRIAKVVDVAEGVNAAELRLQDNLWWGGAEKPLEPDDLPFHAILPQTTDIDPGLDSRCVARNPAAAGFGATTGSVAISTAPIGR